MFGTCAWITRVVLVSSTRKTCSSILLEDIRELHFLAQPAQLLAKWLQVLRVVPLFHHRRGRRFNVISGLDMLPCM